MSASQADEIERARVTEEQPPPPPAARVLLFLFCFTLMLGGFWLMGFAVDHASIAGFTAGIVVSGLGFFLALHRPRR
ncbi:hypothetical protein [Cellulomonas sp. ES6]|uniref:hypothetical protein n=1 Tax=Cellulomonas sp. ES6 TaxID=3039384 RepID=UPI0024B85AE7|nr:hypothetical protein [Cellulomonas sp. ES6]WHP18039.1 hypothetical protein P9841_02375 [Cellulomonas sp. ES6]